MSSRRRRYSGRTWTVVGAVALAILLAAGAWLWLRGRDAGEGPGGAGEPADTMATTAPADSPIDLPDLEASDELVRRMAEGLSSRPELAEWLATDRLVRRFVGAVVVVAAGRSPREELEFLDPEATFEVRRPDEPTVVEPASYRRYDAVAATVASLDNRGTAELYRRLRPLFQEAYRDLGFREGSFDGALARAVETLLAVPVPEGPVEVVPVGGNAYEYRDPELEALSPAQKHLLRMGPDNIQRIQAKLRELAGALDLPVVTGQGE
jgi:hypothetical protein